MFNDDMVVNGSIKGQKTQIFFDSGSSISIIGGEMFKKIENDSIIEPAEFDNIIAVNQTETAVTGLIRANIQIGKFSGEVELNILPESSYQILLGRDFMRDHGASIDYNTNQVTLKDRKTTKSKPKINSSQQPPKGMETFAKVANQVILKPGQESEVPVYPGNDIIGMKLLFTTNEKSRMMGITAQNQLVLGIPNTMKVRIKNNTQTEIIIPPNRIIGSLKKIRKNVVTSGIRQHTAEKKLTGIPPDRVMDSLKKVTKNKEECGVTETTRHIMHRPDIASVNMTTQNTTKKPEKVVKIAKHKKMKNMRNKPAKTRMVRHEVTPHAISSPAATARIKKPHVNRGSTEKPTKARTPRMRKKYYKDTNTVAARHQRPYRRFEDKKNKFKEIIGKSGSSNRARYSMDFGEGDLLPPGSMPDAL